MNEKIAASMVIKLSPELIAAQGKNDREYLTHSINVLLQAIKENPKVSIDEIAKLAGAKASGMGCCCCPGSCCNVPSGFDLGGPVEMNIRAE